MNLNDLKYVIFLMLTIVQWVISYEIDEDKISVSDFAVQPGGATGTHESELDGFKCKFSYQCQGGTNEQWSMGISANKEKTKYLCHIERPGGTKSYLFFQSFKLEAIGAKIIEGAAYNAGGNELKDTDYAIDFSTNSIQDVPGKFQAELGRAMLYAESGKQEL